MPNVIVAIPKEGRRQILREINLLLKRTYPNYPNQTYVTPRMVVHNIYENSGLYPILSKKKQCTAVRLISAYLKEKGRVLRTPGANGRSCWMIPEKA